MDEPLGASSAGAKLVALMRRPIVWGPISTALLALVVLRARPWTPSPLIDAADPRFLLAAAGLNLIVVCLWGVRSAALIRSAGSRIGLGPATLLATMSYAVNSVTPASAGEAVRVVALREGYGVPYHVGLAAILTERFGALWYIGASAAWALFSTEVGLPLEMLLGGWIVISAAPSVWSRTALAPGRLLRRLGSLVATARRTGLLAGARGVDEAISAMLRPPRSALAFALTSAGLFAAFTGQLLLVAASIGVGIEPIMAWTTIGLAMVAGVISLLPFGLGATDVVLTAGLVRAGLDPAVAAALTLGYRLVSTLPLGLLGAAAFWRASTRP